MFNRVLPSEFFNSLQNIIPLKITDSPNRRRISMLLNKPAFLAHQGYGIQIEIAILEQIIKVRRQHGKQSLQAFLGELEFIDVLAVRYNKRSPLGIWHPGSRLLFESGQLAGANPVLRRRLTKMDIVFHILTTELTEAGFPDIECPLKKSLNFASIAVKRGC